MHGLPGVAVPFGPGGQKQWGAGGRFGHIRGTRLLAPAPCPAWASLLPLCLLGACPFQSTHDSRTQTGRRESYGSRRPRRPRSPGVVSGPHHGSGACWKSHVKGHLRQLATVGTRELPHLSRSPCPCRSHLRCHLPRDAFRAAHPDACTFPPAQAGPGWDLAVNETLSIPPPPPRGVRGQQSPRPLQEEGQEGCSREFVG